MIINLSDIFVKSFVPEITGSFPLLARKLELKINRYGETHAELDTSQVGDYDAGLTDEKLTDLLYDFAKKNKNQAIMMHISSVRTMKKDFKSKSPGSLPALKEGLIQFFAADAIDGWLYKKNRNDNKFLPFVIVSIGYYEPTRQERQNGSKPYVMMLFTANSTAHTVSRKSYHGRNSEEFDAVRWQWGEFNKKTIPELLDKAGIYHETPDLKANYERQLALYDEYRPMFGQQFMVDTGSGLTEEDDNLRTNFRQLTVPTKFVNDDKSVTRSFTETRDNSFWSMIAEENQFTRMPVHTYLRMFNLGDHNFSYIHAEEIKPYIFDKTLNSKIILPESHRDLIEVLVEDLPSVSGDVIAGKSGGVCILCKGAPGLGKTLTAEIYSEVSEKPLYRVHSGQLGTDPEEVETALKTIFDRAQKWGCILLLDEADVYIRQRGNDLHHNAVVASFLRTMEYFGGIFFMTTNRSDDVDDAIVSRCIAVIKYEMPNDKEMNGIFRIQSESLQAGLEPAEITKLVNLYSGKLSGRDIKELLKLATKYSIAKNMPVTSEVVRKLAQFKGF